MTTPPMASPSAAPDYASALDALGVNGVFLRRDELVRVTSFNALASVALTIRTRVLNPAGCVVDSADAQTPNTDRSAKTSLVRVDEGWLLDGQVSVSGAAPLLGQTFVVVEVVRGESTAAVPSRVLAAGYVTAKQPLLFPGRTIGSSHDGQGALRMITGTAPGAGVDLSETVPTGARWELIAFLGVLTTSATVANRIPVLVIDDGANVFYEDVAGGNETAGAAWNNCWAQGSPRAFAAGVLLMNGFLPVDNRLGAGFRIKTVTVALQAADQWSAPKYLVREWIEGA